MFRARRARPLPTHGNVGASMFTAGPRRAERGGHQYPGFLLALYLPGFRAGPGERLCMAAGQVQRFEVSWKCNAVARMTGRYRRPLAAWAEDRRGHVERAQTMGPANGENRSVRRIDSRAGNLNDLAFAFRRAEWRKGSSTGPSSLRGRCARHRSGARVHRGGGGADRFSYPPQADVKSVCDFVT